MRDSFLALPPFLAPSLWPPLHALLRGRAAGPVTLTELSTELSPRWLKPCSRTLWPLTQFQFLTQVAIRSAPPRAENRAEPAQCKPRSTEQVQLRGVCTGF
eukprot:jgi/Ulvmu1/7091/UM033_0152.1